MRKRISILSTLFAVAAFVAAGCGSDSVNSPVVDTVAPAAVLDVTASVVGASVEVAWSAGAEPDLAGYRVYRSANNGAMAHLSSVLTTTYTDDAVQAGVVYRYAVTAVDQAGNEATEATSGLVNLGGIRTSRTVFE